MVRSTIDAYCTTSGDWEHVSCNSTGMLFSVISNESGNRVDVDDMHALNSIEIEHHECHEGEMYSLSALASIASNATASLLIRNGATHEMHSKFYVVANGDTELYLSETPSCTGGTTVTPYNMKRSSTNTTDSVFLTTPTISSSGTTISTSYIAGGTKNSRFGGAAREGSEWIMKKNENYLFQAINRSGVGESLLVVLNFYED